MNATAGEIAQGDKVIISYGQRYLSHVIVTRVRSYTANGAEYAMIDYRVSHVGTGSIMLPVTAAVQIVERAA